MALPTSVTVEIEFTAGTWTDVTQYFDSDTGGTTKFGRTSPFGSVAPGTLTLTLSNQDGRFTPNRQLLADGVTVNPYYPNVVPRKRIRVAYVVAGVPYYRFTGYIKGWPTTFNKSVFPQVSLTATTGDDRLARVTMAAPIAQVVNGIDPSYYWPLTDATGATQAVEASNGAAPLTIAGTGPAPTFGAGGPSSGDGTGVKFSPSAASVGQYLTALIKPITGAFSLAVYFNASTPTPTWYDTSSGGGGEALLGLDDGSQSVNWSLTVINNGGSKIFEFVDPNTAGGVVTTPFTVDGGWHLAVISRATSGGPVSVYFDNALIGSSTTSTTLPIQFVYVGNLAVPVDAFLGNIAHVALLNGSQFSSAQRTALYQAMTGFAGETVDARIARFLGYGGLTSSDWNLDASTVTLGTYPQGGADIVTGCQDATTSEGGGAAFYAGTDVKMQFRNRSFRKPGAPVLTINAEGDIDGSLFQPSFDDTLIVNQVQGTRGTASGSSTTQTVTDTASQTAYGLTSSSFTSYASSDSDVLHNAQDQLARQRNPAFQIPQIALDLGTAETAGLYAALASVAIGSRIRVTNLPAGAAPTKQVDVYVEGWADNFSTAGYEVVFDLSPADTPPWFMFDDATYGRWQASGQTLNAGITAAATSLAVATAAGNPTFTTSAGAYPLTIKVGAEQITLNSAPSGSTSPQSFTGVTRGVNGTTAAAQSAGSAVDLAQASTWTL